MLENYRNLSRVLNRVTKSTKLKRLKKANADLRRRLQAQTAANQIIIKELKEVSKVLND